MPIHERIENCFKPEVKSSGKKLFSAEKVSLSSVSDTDVQAYLRVSPPLKVSLATESIESAEFQASCSCPVAKKQRFCKHIWATLLALEEKAPDFLSEKNEINFVTADAIDAPEVGESYEELAKARASVYRKEQYQKQKTRLKDEKNSKKKLQSFGSFSNEVELSLAYFVKNGFPMKEGPSLEILTEAKRKLSQFFHPDKGGTHEETVELNQHCEVLIQFLKNHGGF